VISERLLKAIGSDLRLVRAVSVFRVSCVLS